MATEIERKFLLGNIPAVVEGSESVQIDQGYLAIDERVEVRVRRVDREFVLTIKGGHGEIRDEFEIPLDEKQFEALWPLTEGRRLRKTRHLVPLEGELQVELDVFAGDLAGLVLAELEFASEAESHGFVPPDWLGEEITGDERYAGQSLAVNGNPLGLAGPKNGEQQEMAQGRLKRGLQRSAADRRAQLAAAGLATAGAAVAGKIALDRAADDSGGDKGRAYRLRHKEATEEGVKRIAIEQADKAIEELADLDSGDPAEPVHAARKDLKKLRSLLRLVRDGIGEERYRDQNRRYRDAGRRLSESRDAEVKLDTIAALQGRSDRALPRQALEAWRADLVRERDEVGEGSALLVDVDAAMGEIEVGRDEITHWDFSKDSWKVLASGLLRSYRRGRREMKRAARTPGAEPVHEWRKRVKDLWYQLRIVGGAWPEVIGETADQAHELADLLGDHHDLSVLAEDLGGRESVGERETLLEAIERRQAELLDGALDLGERLYAEKPNAFVLRIGAYWKAWHRA